MDRQILIETLDNAAKAIASLPPEKQFHWASFFLEAVEEEVGKHGLKMIQSLLEERFELGRW